MKTSFKFWFILSGLLAFTYGYDLIVALTGPQKIIWYKVLFFIVFVFMFAAHFVKFIKSRQ